MKVFVCLLSVLLTGPVVAEADRIFHTSICYDLLSSIEYYENWAGYPGFETLLNDPSFTEALEEVNRNVRASHLCNLYSLSGRSKDDVGECLDFIRNLRPEDFPDESVRYLENIYRCRSQLVTVLEGMIRAGYNEYWSGEVQPRLSAAIEGYRFPPGLLDSIHVQIELLAGDSPLGQDYPRIYIIDIGNAFSLNDETFCCTPLLLDEEIAASAGIDFVQVYIHENLLRLYLPAELMEHLDRLYAEDEFYRMSENAAAGYGEGRNEAFVVAAERYVSRRLGLCSDAEVCEELTNYVDGSLVLAPIVYLHLWERPQNLSFGDFLLDLERRGSLAPGSTSTGYTPRMNFTGGVKTPRPDTGRGVTKPLWLPQNVTFRGDWAFVRMPGCVKN